MKAIVVHQYGGPEVLKYEDYPDPVPGPGEVLVRVAATSVNPIDYKRRAGLTKDFYPIQFPGLIGVDVAGTALRIGPGVEGFSVGDRVFAMADNTYAELCVIKAAVPVSYTHLDVYKRQVMNRNVGSTDWLTIVRSRAYCSAIRGQ